MLLKGASVSIAIKDDLKNRIEILNSRDITPCIAMIRVGNKADDLAYQRMAIKKCESIGIKCIVVEYPEDVVEAEIEDGIINLNNDDSIHGILMFMPLPGHLNEDKIKHMISISKDVDCANPVNAAKVFAGDPKGFAPCTPEACIRLLKHYGISLEGMDVTIIGRSMVVGRPLAMLFIKEHATITVCHTRTRNLAEKCRRSNILVAAAGSAGMVKANYVSEGMIVIDVGINIDEKGKLCGDVDFDDVEPVAESISPVPGGVGTVTTSVLAEHVVRAAEEMVE